jgi:hypothetical protein
LLFDQAVTRLRRNMVAPPASPSSIIVHAAGSGVAPMLDCVATIFSDRSEYSAVAWSP